MTPAQFLIRVRQQVAPAYLLLGREDYDRRRCREALLDAVLGPEGRESGLTRYDLSGTSLAEVIDDARSLSLFAAARVIVAESAEAALPHGRTSEDATEDGAGAHGSADALAAYMRDPSPGVTLVFEATRFDFEGEDKKKLDRIRKFYSVIPEVMELRRYSAQEARAEAQALARRASVTLDPSALELLVEALAADMARISMEIEKLALLDMLDTLTREGEYLPMALAFLATQFRLALVAREAGLRSAQQIQSHFTRQGIQMWGSRAEQVYQTVSRFSSEQLHRAVKLVFAADRDLRSARPDDRTIMEHFVMELTR